MMVDVKRLAEFMHRRYEFHSMTFNWATQKQCRVEFDDLPEENKKTMTAVAKDVMELLIGVKGE